MSELTGGLTLLEQAILRAKQLAGARHPDTYRALAKALDCAEREGRGQMTPTTDVAPPVFEPSASQIAAANATREMFEAFTRAGFTEPQALALIGHMLSAAGKTAT